jgi:hypothetical protein
MPLVSDGDKSAPFIITRDSAYKDSHPTDASVGGDPGWQVCYPYPAENADKFFGSQKETDPCAVMYTGADFANGSFPTVYDTVLRDRLRAELFANRTSGAYFSHTDERVATALFHFFEERISEFSHKLTDYLTTVDNPLAVLAETCPYDMTPGYDGETFMKILRSTPFTIWRTRSASVCRGTQPKNCRNPNI